MVQRKLQDGQYFLHLLEKSPLNGVPPNAEERVNLKSCWTKIPSSSSNYDSSNNRNLPGGVKEAASCSLLGTGNEGDIVVSS